MNFIKKYILLTIAAISLCVLAVSCSQDYDLEHGDKLPAGKYPLKFTATVDGMVSRADNTEFWEDGDTIKVRIGSYPWIGQYELNTDGTVKDAIDPLAWPHTDDFVSAWFPFLDNDTEVAISDQSNGYHNFDFKAASTERSMNYKEIVHLNFEHQMAKVRCNLFKGEGITAEDLATAKVSYYGFTSVTFAESGLTGHGNGLITPRSDWEAVLLPQDMTGRPFIKIDLTVTLNQVEIPKTLIFTPEPGKGELKAGTSYTFNVTVNKDRLEIKQITGQWNDDNGPDYANECPRLVNLPKGHGQTIRFSSNVTPMPENATGGDIEYLLVRGTEFTLYYEVNSTNYMKGFVLSKTDAEKKTR